MFRRSMYLDKLEMYLNRDVVKIITGVRRSGKTTLIRQFISELKESGIPEENIIYLNFEGMIYAYLTKATELRTMLVELISGIQGRAYIFLDEVQNIDGWAQVAAELLNLSDCDLYVSSSNASIFKNDFARLLAYRYVRIEVYPLTFGEYLKLTEKEIGHGTAGRIAENTETQKSTDKYNTQEAFEDNTGEDPSLQTPVFSKEELFADYLRRGCMPGVYALKPGTDISDYLSDVYNTIILKDVVQRNNLRDISHIDKIMEFLLGHTGEVFSPKAIKDYVKGKGAVISVDTVYSCLDALTGAYLINKVPRFDIKTDRELETQEKYYICDIAMRNAVMYDEGMSFGAQLENILNLEMLSRGFKLYVAKLGQSQIDFMAVKGQDRTYLNCCETVADKEAVKREFGPLTRIRDNYFKMVLSMDPETMVNKGGIINFPLISFLNG